MAFLSLFNNVTLAQQKLFIGENELNTGSVNTTVSGYHFYAGTTIQSTGSMKAIENMELKAMGFPLDRIRFRPKWGNGMEEIKGLSSSFQDIAWFGGLYFELE